MKRLKPKKRKEPMWARLFLAVTTLLSVLLSVLLKVMNRQETVKAIKSEDTIMLLKAGTRQVTRSK